MAGVYLDVHNPNQRCAVEHGVADVVKIATFSNVNRRLDKFARLAGGGRARRGV